MPVSSRISIIYAERGTLEVDGYSVVLRQEQSRTHIPIGATSCLMLAPGVVVTHAAVKACAEEGTLLIWTGEQGVRCYSAGEPGGASGDRILLQAAVRLDENSRLRVARCIFKQMFDDEAPKGRSVDQLRGLEGTRVKELYAAIAKLHGVTWLGRTQRSPSDIPNQCLSHATAALYGLTEAVILSLGYSPAIGFVHSGNSRSFVYDVADTVKFKTVVPLAFEIAQTKPISVEPIVRTRCRDLFKELRLAEQLVSNIEDMFQNAVSGN